MKKTPEYLMEPYTLSDHENSDIPHIHTAKIQYLSYIMFFYICLMNKMTIMLQDLSTN